MNSDERLTWWERWRAIPSSAWWLLLLFFLLISPCLVRTWSLSQVPDLGNPFDVAEFCKSDIPDDENAINVYTIAFEKYSAVDAAAKLDPKQQGLNPGIAFEKRTGTPEEQVQIAFWRAVHRDALLEWKRGTSYQRAQHQHPLKVTESSWLKNQNAALRLHLLARLEAEEFEQRGELDSAWEWHRANFRFSRHLGHGGTLLDRLIGNLVHREAVHDLVRWAEFPTVTADQLQIAFDEVRAMDMQPAPWSDCLKAEYVWRNAQLQKVGLHQLATEIPKLFPGEPVVCRQFRLWTLGEPELVLRLHRQVLANCLNEMDKPLTQQGTIVSTSPLLFAATPSAAALPKRLKPAEIQFAIKRSFLGMTLRGSGMIGRDQLSHVERSQQAILEMVLALQRYRREHNEFPAELSLLVPQYIGEIPVDPCDPSGQPIRYRRDERGKAIVWSVGQDHRDDGGLVTESPNAGQGSDLGFVVK